MFEGSLNIPCWLLYIFPSENVEKHKGICEGVLISSRDQNLSF